MNSQILIEKLKAGKCLFDWENKIIFAEWNTPLEDELREFKKKHKFIIQYEIR